MQLKRYQQTALDRLMAYLRALNAAREKLAQIRGLNLDIDYAWDNEAWKSLTGIDNYQPRKNGLGNRVPVVCLKVPTGGGKTLLAVHGIDLINQHYRREQTGLVLWIVPTAQIYTQTLRALKDRAHPYRTYLDLASANRTLIREKTDLFTPDDVANNLVALLLMLPSANRQTKETLRMFKDRGGFEAFFPREDDFDAQRELLALVPNLDAFDSEDAVAPRTVKTSLGNVLRLLQPVIVLDEGHKAYGELAQSTLLGFNPSFILELSATPTPQSNKLVSISGQELLREGMIKLDVNVYNKASDNWRDTLRDAHLHRAQLELIAHEYEQSTGTYVRPICLIQVERTGKDQREAGLVHAEDAREFLQNECKVLSNQIAVKSSEKDEIKAEDLLSRDSQIRYIITKSALQEGWDCSFAYILTVLTNPRKAGSSITQLVGRVLRQPYATKTGRQELDESYVYCYRNAAGNLIRLVAAGLQEEGLGDLVGRITNVEDSSKRTEFHLRAPYADWAGKVYLPCFIVQDEASGEWREVGYEMDVLRRIDWNKIDLSLFDTLQLNPTRMQDSAVAVGLNAIAGLKQVTFAPDMPIDLAFITQQLAQAVPNPWVAFEFAEAMVNDLRKRPYSDENIKRDLPFAVEELRRTIIEQSNRLTEEVFLDLIKREALRFVLLAGTVGAEIPDKIVATPTAPLIDGKGQPPQLGLFDYRADDFNSTERDVVLYLDQQSSWVIGWLRNLPKSGYGIQGWRPNKIYPDFMVFSHNDIEALSRFTKVYVLETKGLHLKGSEDTQYKQDLFKLCNELSKPKPFDIVKKEWAEHRVYFQVVYENDWQRIINAMATEP